MTSQKLLLTWGLLQTGNLKSASASLGGNSEGEQREHYGQTIARHVDRFFDQPDYRRWRALAIHVYCHCLPADTWPWQKPGVMASQRLMQLGLGMFMGLAPCRVSEAAQIALERDFEDWYAKNSIAEIVEMFERAPRAA